MPLGSGNPGDRPHGLLSVKGLAFRSGGTAAGSPLTPAATAAAARPGPDAPQKQAADINGGQANHYENQEILHSQIS